MKRYAVFAFYRYEAAGGWNDFQDAFDTVDACRDFLINEGKSYDRSHIVDLQTGNIVLEYQ